MNRIWLFKLLSKFTHSHLWKFIFMSPIGAPEYYVHNYLRVRKYGGHRKTANLELCREKALGFRGLRNIGIKTWAVILLPWTRYLASRASYQNPIWNYMLFPMLSDPLQVVSNP